MPSADLENEACRPTEAGARLRAFRERLFASFGRRADALFELTDAVLATGPVPSTVHLSLAPTHRRSWCSLYAALSKGQTFYAEPEIPPKRPVGRPFRHSRKFSCKDPSTWPEPTAGHLTRSADYGAVRIRAWSGLHPKTRRSKERYGLESAAVVTGTVVLVEV